MVFPPWQVSGWKAVDDRVRGGSSQSHLDPIKLSSLDNADSLQTGTKDSDEDEAARFWGTLDTQALGGAGFASQRFTFGPTPLHLPLSEYQGLQFTYLTPRPTATTSSTSETTPAKPHSYTLVLKSTLPTYPPPEPTDPPKNPSPEPSTLSYELTFDTSDFTSTRPTRVCLGMHFEDFVPTYRGREVKKDNPMYRPLQSETIYELSLMCRSGFGEQEGEFELIVLGIEGWKTDSVNAGGAGMLVGVWNGVLDMITGFWSWWCALGRGDEGLVRLSDDEEKSG